MRAIRPPLLLACVILALIAIPTIASALTVTSITPAVAYADSTRIYDVYGTGFASDAGVTLTPTSGGAAIAATKVERLDATHLRCTVTVPPGAVTGRYGVTVSNPKADSGSMADAFTVYARPTVTGMVPAALPPGSSFAGRIEGTGFVPGAEVFVRGGPGGSSLIFATGETPIGTTRIDCGFTVPFDAYPGPYDVYIRSHDDLPDLLAKTGAFTVELPEATFITAVSPSSAVAGATVSVDVTGNGFTSGAEVIAQGGPSGGPTQIVASGETLVAPGTARCTLPIPADAYIGPYTVFLRNPGGEWVYKLDTFTVTASTPTVTGISPESGALGDTIENVRVTGTGFTRGALVVLYHEDHPAWFDATDETWVSPTEIRCTFAIPPGTLSGLYRARVVNPGGVQSSTYASFSVFTPMPTVTGISSIRALPGVTLTTVYVYGTGFISGSEVVLKGGVEGSDPFTEIYATGETRINSTTIRCSLAIPVDVSPGPYDVLVSNPRNGAPPIVSAPLADAFTVTTPIPHITEISPASAGPGDTLPSVYVYGSGFARGAEVAIDGGYGPIDATGETWVNSTTIRCSLALPTDLAPGRYTVIVLNPGLSVWYGKQDAFTVLAPTPTITGISPASAHPGDVLSTVYVTGTGFVEGAIVQVYGSGDRWVASFTATSVTLVNATAIRCSLAVPADATPDLYDVYIRNPPGFEIAAGLSDGFTVLRPTPAVAVPPSALVPTDPDGNGKYEDVNGNGRKDFADVVLYFNQMSWIAANEPISLFDYNGNGRIDFADVVWLFNNI